MGPAEWNILTHNFYHHIYSLSFLKRYLRYLWSWGNTSFLLIHENQWVLLRVWGDHKIPSVMIFVYWATAEHSVGSVAILGSLLKQQIRWWCHCQSFFLISWTIWLVTFQCLYVYTQTQLGMHGEKSMCIWGAYFSASISLYIIDSQNCEMASITAFFNINSHF